MVVRWDSVNSTRNPSAPVFSLKACLQSPKATALFLELKTCADGANGKFHITPDPLQPARLSLFSRILNSARGEETGDGGGVEGL